MEILTIEILSIIIVFIIVFWKVFKGVLKRLKEILSVYEIVLKGDH